MKCPWGSVSDVQLEQDQLYIPAAAVDVRCSKKVVAGIRWNGRTCEAFANAIHAYMI